MKSNDSNSSSNDNNKSLGNHNSDRSYDWNYVQLVRAFLKIAFYNDQ